MLLCSKSSADDYVYLELHEGTLRIQDQIHDYIDRGDELDDLSYLDFFLNTYDMRSDRDPSAVHKSDGTSVLVPYKQDSHHAGHVRVIRTEGHETMPHFPGNWFPPASDEEHHEFHCASMLALLKPWRDITDIKKPSDLFSSTFENFVSHAPEIVTRIITNIQYFHDCADKAKSERERDLGFACSTATLDAGEHLDDNANENDEDIVMEGEKEVDDEFISDDDIVNASENCGSARELLYADVALNIAEEFGFFDEEQYTTISTPANPAKPASHEDLQKSLEWEKTITLFDEPHIDCPPPGAPDHDTGNPFSTPVNNNSSISHANGHNPSLQNSTIAPPYLNEEQTMAFNIVAHHLMEHLQGKDPPQLLMAVHGQGGTGKTRLLEAITSLFSDLGCADLFAKTALTGVAACQIGGKTLHSWATIPAGKGLPRTDTWIHRPSRETAKKRIANMRGKFLFAADEMSLLTTDLLYFLSQITSAFRATEGAFTLNIINIFFEATDSPGIPPQLLTTPFAGLSAMILGDFHQFPPIAGHHRALYSQNPQSAKSQLGRNIYLQFDTVIQLKQQIRITDTIWNDILQRARIGACTSDDLSEIRRLVLTNAECSLPDFSSPPWNDAILITPRNSVQSRWNSRATRKHCLRTGQILYVCPAEDSAHNAPLSSAKRLITAKMPLKQTEQLPTIIRICKGMRIMITRNISTTANLSNGSRGRITDIILDPREPKVESKVVDTREVLLRYPPAMVIVHLDFCELPPLQGLPPQHVPVSPSQCRFSIATTPSTRVTRRQLPLIPAYAFTDFKAQGQTIDNVLVDIGKTTCFALSPFNAYVALSRSHGRNCIRLLRDFDNDLFLRYPSEDLRIEDIRIEQQAEETKKHYIR